MVLTISLIAIISSVHSVDAQFDTSPPLPIVKLLLDTSGSMGYVCDDSNECEEPKTFRQVVEFKCDRDNSSEEISAIILESVEDHCSRDRERSVFVVETYAGEIFSGFLDNSNGISYFLGDSVPLANQSLQDIVSQQLREKCEGVDNECDSFIQTSPISDSDLRDSEHSSFTDSQKGKKFFSILDSTIAKFQDISELSEANDSDYYAEKVKFFSEAKSDIRSLLSNISESDYESDLDEYIESETREVKIKINTSNLPVKEKLEVTKLLDELESAWLDYLKFIVSDSEEDGIGDSIEMIVDDGTEFSKSTTDLVSDSDAEDREFGENTDTFDSTISFSDTDTIAILDKLENIADEILTVLDVWDEELSTVGDDEQLEDVSMQTTLAKIRDQIFELTGNKGIDWSDDNSTDDEGGYFFDDIKITVKSVIPQKSGTNSYYVVKDIVHSKRGGTSQVQCDEGDILKGGGFSRASGSVVSASIPNSISGKLGSVGEGPHSTFGICWDLPPKREKSQLLESEFDSLANLRESLGKISDDDSSTIPIIDKTKIVEAKVLIDELRDSSSSSTIAGRINPSELWKLKEINDKFTTDEFRENLATLRSENVIDIPDPRFIDTIHENDREIIIKKVTELDISTEAQYDLIFDKSVVDKFDGLEQTEQIDITPDMKYLDERLEELAESNDDIDIDELRQDVLDKKGVHAIEEQIVIKKNLFIPENLALDPSEFLLTKQSIQNEFDYSDYLSIYATGDGSSSSGAESTSSDASSGVTKSTGARITTSAEYSHTFLNGFTLGNNYEWSWNKKWETKRGFEIAYVGISAELTYGFGLRVPFEVTATIDDDEHSPSDKDDTYFNVDYTIDTLNLTGEQMGDLGLPKSKQFDGKEFVLEFGAQANLKVRLLEKTVVDKQIGDIIDKGSNFETPLGSKTAEIADIEIDGNLIGLVYTTGILKIMLDVGLIVDLGSDGVVMDVTPLNSSGGGTITFTNDGETISEEYKVKTVYFFSGDSDYVEFGTTLDDVEYLPEVLLTPKTRLTGVIETGVFGEYTISTPWIEVYTFEIDLPALGTHDGTVGELEVGPGKMNKSFKMGYGPDEFVGKPSSTPSSFSPTK